MTRPDSHRVIQFHDLIFLIETLFIIGSTHIRLFDFISLVALLLLSQVSTLNFDCRTFLSIFLINIVRCVDNKRRCRLTLKHFTFRTFASRAIYLLMSFVAVHANQLSSTFVTVVTRCDVRDETNPRFLELQVLEFCDEGEGECDDEQGEEPFAKSGSDRKATSPVIEAVMCVAPSNFAL